jgi:hypothetical protein
MVEPKRKQRPVQDEYQLLRCAVEKDIKHAPAFIWLADEEEKEESRWTGFLTQRPLPLVGSVWISRDGGMS